MAKGIKERAIKDVAKGAGILFIGVVFSKVFTLIYRIVSARLLLPESYGMLSLAIAVYEICVILVHIGIPTGVNRYVSMYRGRGDERRIKGTITSALKITIPLSIFTATVVFFLSDFIASVFFHNPAVSPVIKLIVVAIPFQTLLINSRSIIMAFKEIKYRVYSENILQGIIKVALIILLALIGIDVLGATLAFVLSIMVSGIICFYFVEFKIFPIIRSNIKPIHNYSELFRYSWPLAMSGVVGLIARYVDTFMLGYFMAESEVGIYNAAMIIATSLVLFINSLGGILFPVLSELYGRGEKDVMVDTYKASAKWGFSATLPMFMLMVLFPTPIVRLIYGSSYTTAATPLSILAFGFFSSALVGGSTLLLQSIGKTKPVFGILAFAAVSNVILNYILIPKYGVVGAAIATCTTLTAKSFMSLISAYHYTKMHPYKRSYYKSILASLFSVGTVYVVIKYIFATVPLWVLLPAFLAFVALYGVSFILLKGIDEDDIIILRALDKKFGIKTKWIRNLAKMSFSK